LTIEFRHVKDNPKVNAISVISAASYSVTTTETGEATSTTIPLMPVTTTELVDEDTTTSVTMILFSPTMEETMTALVPTGGNSAGGGT
jgi:altronate dehydratase